jgi:competence protein ComFC
MNATAARCNPETSWKAFVSEWTERVLSLLYPRVCQVCHEGCAGAKEGYVCTTCRSKRDGVQFITQPFCGCCGLPFDGEITVSFECTNCRDQELHFRSARAAVRFVGLVQEVIHRYKYNHSTWFEPFLSDLLIQKAAPGLSLQEWDLIVPIPLHWVRLRERSFNQSARLAKRLSQATGIPVNAKLLRRVAATRTQTTLSRSQRIENMKNAFIYRGRNRLKGENIVLLDDVLTTGATANACAKLLRQNGAGLVDVWTVARGILK